MHTFLTTVYDQSDDVLESFEQNSPNLRVALEDAALHLSSLPFGHGHEAVRATVERTVKAVR